EGDVRVDGVVVLVTLGAEDRAVIRPGVARDVGGAQVRDAGDVVAELRGEGRVEVDGAVEGDHVRRPGEVEGVPGGVGEPGGDPRRVLAAVDRRGVRPVGEVRRGRRGDVIARPITIVGRSDFDHRGVVDKGVAGEGQHLRLGAVADPDVAGRVPAPTPGATA